MAERIIHSHEVGRRGKPDRLDSDIAHLLAAEVLRIDPYARCDIRVVGTYDLESDSPLVEVSGEVSKHVLAQFREGVRVITARHYRSVHLGNDNGLIVKVDGLTPQSSALAHNTSAGDSGTPIAIAFANTPNHLPWERYLSVEIRDLIDHIYTHYGKVPERLAEISNVSEIQGLRADGKVSVEVEYSAGLQHPSLTDVTIAVNHEKTLGLEVLRRDLNAVVHAYLALNAGELFGDSFFQRNILINGAGAWQDEGGWKTDKGTRDAKPQEAYFGSHGVAEDVPWGEDPTKPSGTGSFLARYIANQVVGNGLADVARVTLVYKIGQSEPRINIFTNGTGKIFQQEIERWVERELVDLSISGTIDRFFLRRPELYKRIVQGSDLFHDYGLPWNKVDLRYREK